jgi:hypothetical protein
MRLATKNEMLTIMGDRATYFAGFCTSVAGEVTKFLFDNTTNYDLDLPVVQGMITQLYAGGILDTACLERFAAFGQSVEAPTERVGYVYEVPEDYNEPLDTVSSGRDAAKPGFKTIAVVTAIPGLTEVYHGVL